MNKIRTVLGLAMISGFALVSTGTSAVSNTKSYPGAICQKASANGALGYFIAGQVVNLSSTSSLDLICPFVRDEAVLVSGSVKMYNFNPTAEVTCQIRTETINTSGGFANAVSVTTSGVSGLVQTKGFSTGSPTGDYYVALCKIPPTFGGNASRVSSFSLTE